MTAWQHATTRESTIAIQQGTMLVPHSVMVGSDDYILYGNGITTAVYSYQYKKRDTSQSRCVHTIIMLLEIIVKNSCYLCSMNYDVNSSLTVYYCIFSIIIQALLSLLLTNLCELSKIQLKHVYCGCNRDGLQAVQNGPGQRQRIIDNVLNAISRLIGS